MHGWRDGFAQVLHAGEHRCVALFPCCEQVGKHLAVGLHGELFKSHVGGFKSFTLGAEGCIAKAWATVFKRWMVTTTRGTIVARGTVFTITTVGLKLIVSALARTAWFAAGATTA